MAKPQLNPFYIEQVEDVIDDDDEDGAEFYDDWRYDDDDVEAEGLLENGNNQYHAQRQQQRQRQQEDAFAVRQQRYHQHSYSYAGRSSHYLRLRYLIGFLVMFVLFMVLLSLTTTTKTTATQSSSGQEHSSATTTAATAASNSSNTSSTTNSSSSSSSSTTHSSSDDDDDDDDDHRQVEIVILGERNSGVHWLEHHLQACYPNVTVSHRLTRDAYWFQDKPTITEAGSGRPLNNNQHSNLLLLLVTIFRNPYDWIYQMNQHPMYMPSHMDGTNNNNQPMASLQDFVTKPWTLVTEQDNHTNTTNITNVTTTTTTTCQLGFTPQQVIPCQITGDPENQATHAIYELNPDTPGKPFANIAELRAAKIHHLVEQVPVWWKDHLLVTKESSRQQQQQQQQQQHPGVLIVQYESALFDSLERIESITGWQRVCTENAMAPNNNNDDDDTLPELTNYMEWINKHIEWDMEEKVGYQKRTN